MTTLNPFFGIVIDDTFTQIKCNSEVIYHLWTNDAILTTKNITYSNDTIRDITVKFDKGQNETLDKLDVNQSGVFVFSENAIIHKIECQVNFKQISGNEITLTLMPNKSAVDTISLDTDKIPVKSTTTIEMTNSQASGIFSQLKISADEGNNIVLKPDGIYVPQPSSEGFNYEDATNKPTVNNVELIGNKTSSDLGLSSKEDVDSVKQDVETSKQDIQTINNNIDTINAGLETIDDNFESVRTSINNINGELETINSTISNIDEVLIPNKANITLDNVNVGSGKENKIPSFNADGSIKFIDQPTSSFELNYLGIEVFNPEPNVNYQIDCDGIVLISRNRSYSSPIITSFPSSVSSVPSGTNLTIEFGNIFPNNTTTVDRVSNRYGIAVTNTLTTTAVIDSSSIGKSLNNYAPWFTSIRNYELSHTFSGKSLLKFTVSTAKIGTTFNSIGFIMDGFSIMYYGTTYTPLNPGRGNVEYYGEYKDGELINVYHSSCEKYIKEHNLQPITEEQLKEFQQKEFEREIEEKNI